MTERDQYALEEALETVECAATGNAALLMACRRIVGLQHRLGHVPDEILDPIRAVESELDDVPGELNSSGVQSDYMNRKMQERDEYLDRVRSSLVQCFHELREYLIKVIEHP